MTDEAHRAEAARDSRKWADDAQASADEARNSAKRP
jgi:hypothetical protein